MKVSLFFVSVSSLHCPVNVSHPHKEAALLFSWSLSQHIGCNSSLCFCSLVLNRWRTPLVFIRYNFCHLIWWEPEPHCLTGVKRSHKTSTRMHFKLHSLIRVMYGEEEKETCQGEKYNYVQDICYVYMHIYTHIHICTCVMCSSWRTVLPRQRSPLALPMRGLVPRAQLPLKMARKMVFLLISIPDKFGTEWYKHCLECCSSSNPDTAAFPHLFLKMMYKDGLEVNFTEDAQKEWDTAFAELSQVEISQKTC